MHREGNEIVLDETYEKKLGILPARFPLTAIASAITSVRHRMELPAKRAHRSFVQERQDEPYGGEELMYDTEYRQLCFMLSDLERLNRS
jgi:hypothetical protein